MVNAHVKLTEDKAAEIRRTVYSSKEEILQELERRRNNTNLKKKVRALFADYPIRLLESDPFFAFSRVIFTPNFEFSQYMRVAKELKLSPQLLEYTDGKFVARDSEKYLLCKMYFFNPERHGKRGGIPCVGKRVVNFNTNEGNKFHHVTTEWGEPIVHFHHWLLDTQYPNLSDQILDFSDWFNQTRTLHQHYYFYFLSLFVQNGALCENYLLDDGDEADFAVTHLMPSFRAVTEYFGVKPLIYHLLPTENENSRDWLSYNESILPLVEGRAGHRGYIA